MNVEQALRQSLDALALSLIQPHGGYSKGTDFIVDLARSIEARLSGAAAPAPPEPDLDVERLARAIDAAWRRDGSDHHMFGPGLAGQGVPLARLIAAEWPDV